MIDDLIYGKLLDSLYPKSFLMTDEGGLQHEVIHYGDVRESIEKFRIELKQRLKTTLSKTEMVGDAINRGEMRSVSGPMCGLDEAIGYVESLHPVADPMPKRIVRRLQYMKAKEDGIKPTFHTGIYGKKFDSYHCGNCAKEGLRVTDNFCPNCGYRILWDSTRCLTR